jgi:hypothetical protein
MDGILTTQDSRKCRNDNNRVNAKNSKDVCHGRDYRYSQHWKQRVNRSIKHNRNISNRSSNHRSKENKKMESKWKRN